jgi:hypothetical protein
MIKHKLCYAVYNAKKDLVGQPVLINSILLIDIGEIYSVPYTDDWKVISFI